MIQLTSLSAHWEVKQVSLVIGITYSKQPLYTGPLGFERKVEWQLHVNRECSTPRDLQGQGGGGDSLVPPAGARIDSAAN